MMTPRSRRSAPMSAATHAPCPACGCSGGMAAKGGTIRDDNRGDATVQQMESADARLAQAFRRNRSGVR